MSITTIFRWYWFYSFNFK